MVLMFVKNKGEFVDQVVATRNYFTHFDKEPEANVLKGERLYWTTRKLRALLEVCLMNEIGLSVDLMTRLLKRNQQMVFLAQK